MVPTSPLRVPCIVLALAFSSGMLCSQDPAAARHARGQVLDDATGKPIAAAKVQIQVMGRGPAATEVLVKATCDAEGRFELSYERPGRRGVILVASAPGHVRKTQPLRRRTPKEIILRLGKGHTVVGILVDSSTGKPLPGGRIRFETQTVHADQNGRFRIAGLPRDFVDSALEFSVDGYAVQMFPGPIPDGASRPMRVALKKAQVHAVTVQDEAGKPLQGLPLVARLPFADPYTALERKNFQATSDENGQVLLKGLLPDQAYVVEATMKGALTTQSGVFTARPPEAAHKPIQLILSPGRRSAIRVIDAGGQAIVDADVRLLPLTERRQAFQGNSRDETTRGPIRFGRTDASGQVAFDLLPANPVTCEVRVSGHHTAMILLDPAIGDPVPVVITLEKDPNPPGTQIPWRGGLTEAFNEARRRNLPVMFQMTMDNERANDWMAGHHFKDPEVVRVARELPILLASAFGPGGIMTEEVDHRVENGVSTRYGHIHPRIYQAVERYASANLVQLESFQVPREIFVTTSGRQLIHRTYYLTERDLVRLMLRAARFTQTELPLKLARQRLAHLARSLAASDDAVRSRAVDHLILLANSGDEHARALILGLSEIGAPVEVRKRVLASLVLPAYRYPTAILRGFTTDPDAEIRAACYARMTSLDEDADITALFESCILKEDKVFEKLFRAAGIEGAAAQLSVTRVGENERWRILQALITRAGLQNVLLPRELVEELAPQGRNAILRILARTTEAGAFLDFLGDLSLDSADDVPWLGALALVFPRIRSPRRVEEAQTILDLALQSSCNLVREEATKMLGMSADPASAPRLRECLKDDDLHVRYQAAVSLALRGDHSGAPVLAEALQTGSLAMHARICLGRLRGTDETFTTLQWLDWLEELKK